MTWMRKAYHIVGSVIICGGLIATPFLPHLIYGDYPDRINIYALFLIYLLNSGISYFLFAYKEVLLIADQRKDIELTEENKKQFLIPKGFAHGFLVLSDIAEFCYKCDDFYHPNDEGGLAWNDPEIGIVWPDIVGNYPGNADSAGYTLSDGTSLNL